MSLDNRLRNPQSKASANVFLRGEKWFEDALQMFGCDAGPVVLYPNLNSLSSVAVDTLDTDLQRASRLDRIGGIRDDISDNLLHFSGKAL
jgi:hypothetical protein